jgi:copper transport protein
MGNRYTGKHRTSRDTSRVQYRRWKLLFALLLGLSVAVFLFLPIGLLSGFISEAYAHALPVRSDPSANAILRVPPTHVSIWFDDALVAATSHIAVENAQGQEVDRRDSTVSSADPHEMTVKLPSLPAGTYTVVWVAQSTDDGHVTEGSFVFSIARSNGTVPPTSAGHPPGGNISASTNTSLDGPSILQTLATWLALLCLTFWVGGLIWETWILSPDAAKDSDLAAAAIVASQRFRRLTPYLLGGLLIADIALIVSESAALAGNWAGAFAPSLWQAMLFDNRFGLFWWMRQGIALLALVLTLGVTWRNRLLWRCLSVLKAQSNFHTETSHTSSPDQHLQTIPPWWSAVLEMVRGLPGLPSRLVGGWRRRSWIERAELVLAAALLVVFALSGHAAAVPSSELAYSLAVDLLHLLGNAAWVGGLLYIGFVLLPALYRLNERQHARVLALGLPQFSALALISVIVLAISGPLNASIHLTSLQQVVTTLYGRILVVKSEFFLLMVAMSIYHAFSLRPRLTLALTPSKQSATEIRTSTLVKAALTHSTGSADPLGEVQVDEGISEQAWHLAERMETWLRREAMLGVAVLLCVALLSTFAGTLVPS